MVQKNVYEQKTFMRKKRLHVKETFKRLVKERLFNETG